MRRSHVPPKGGNYGFKGGMQGRHARATVQVAGWSSWSESSGSRFTLRNMGRSPGLAIVIALSLALGIGANTADLQPHSRRDDEEPAGAGPGAAGAAALVRRRVAEGPQPKRQRRTEQSGVQGGEPLAGLPVLPDGAQRDGPVRRGLCLRAARGRAQQRDARGRGRRGASRRGNGVGRVFPRPRRVAGLRAPDLDRRRARRGAGGRDQPRLLDAPLRRGTRRGRPGDHRQPRAVHDRRRDATRSSSACSPDDRPTSSCRC